MDDLQTLEFCDKLAVRLAYKSSSNFFHELEARAVDFLCFPLPTGTGNEKQRTLRKWQGSGGWDRTQGKRLVGAFGL